jgi:SAM-dependent methyltransferase
LVKLAGGKPALNAARDQATEARYTALLAGADSDHEAVGWGSAASQARRFEVLSEIGDLRGKTILDVGCGLGAFHDWLAARGIEHCYYGCDITEPMAERARDRTGLTTIWHCGIDNIAARSGLARFDYVFASGIFCFDVEGGHDAMIGTIAQMFALSEIGVGANSLSSLAVSKADTEFYAEPARALSDALVITRRSVLRHDYHPADFTLYLYRDQT